VGRAASSELDLPAAHRRAVQQVVAEFGRFPAKKLELLATAYYLYRGLDGHPRDAGEAVQAVLALKPHFHAPEVELALQELEAIERRAAGGQE
jgi:hypothetical protein